MKIIKYKLLSILILFFNFYSPWARPDNNTFDFSLQRMTYIEGSKSISLGLRNNENQPYLVQANMRWLDESTGLNLLNKKEKTPFLLTPLLQKIAPKEYYEWVIKFVGSETALPTDKESVYIAQFRLIPSTTENQSNIQMTFIRALNFKIYYRPKALENIKIKDAEKKLSFTIEGDYLIAHNNSPIYLSFNTIKVNSKEIELQELSKIVPPFGTKKYILNKIEKITSIHWQVLDELMFPLEERTMSIQ